MTPDGISVQKQRTEQTIDHFGNLKQSKIYGYGSPAALLRTFDSVYRHEAASGASDYAAYGSSRIRHRLVKATMTVAGGNPVTLVTNAYDEHGAYVPCSPVAMTLSAPTSSITMHDDTNYGTAFTRRGNLTSSRAMQDSWGCKSYETTGNLLTSFGPSQPTVNVIPSAQRNNAAPQAMSVGGLTTTFDWNGLLQLTGVDGAEQCDDLDQL